MANMYIVHTRIAQKNEERERERKARPLAPTLSVKHFNYVMIIFQYIFFSTLRKSRTMKHYYIAIKAAHRQVSFFSLGRLVVRFFVAAGVQKESYTEEHMHEIASI